jgi:hypothetical protein
MLSQISAGRDGRRYTFRKVLTSLPPPWSPAAAALPPSQPSAFSKAELTSAGSVTVSFYHGTAVPAGTAHSAPPDAAAAAAAAASDVKVVPEDDAAKFYHYPSLTSQLSAVTSAGLWPHARAHARGQPPVRCVVRHSRARPVRAGALCACRGARAV